ncbi:MAG TPA: hypothetical protein VGN26_01640 [Armatimonadota bacterium]|jgi:hypothetical protein
MREGLYRLGLGTLCGLPLGAAVFGLVGLGRYASTGELWSCLEFGIIGLVWGTVAGGIISVRDVPLWHSVGGSVIAAVGLAALIAGVHMAVVSLRSPVRALGFVVWASRDLGIAGALSAWAIDSALAAARERGFGSPASVAPPSRPADPGRTYRL